MRMEPYFTTNESLHSAMFRIERLILSGLVAQRLEQRTHNCGGTAVSLRYVAGQPAGPAPFRVLAHASPKRRLVLESGGGVLTNSPRIVRQTHSMNGLTLA